MKFENYGNSSRYETVEENIFAGQSETTEHSHFYQIRSLPKIQLVEMQMCRNDNKISLMKFPNNRN